MATITITKPRKLEATKACPYCVKGVNPRNPTVPCFHCDEGRIKTNPIKTPGHTKEVFEPALFQKVVRKFVTNIRKHPKIRAVAACGNSGVPLAGAISFITGLPMIAVRKPEERSHVKHGGLSVTGFLGKGEYTIVDDVIDSGSTIRHIVQSINSSPSYYGLKPGDMKLHSILLYRENSGSDHNLDDLLVPILHLAS